MFSRSNKKIQLGDIVTYGTGKQKKTGRVFKINNAMGGLNYDIYDGEFLDNVKSFVKLSSDNVTTKFRINCTPVNTDFQFNNYIFLLMTKTRNKTPYYRLIRNSEYNKYIYNFGDIPKYILYFIFINCYWNSSEPNKSVFNKINDFAKIFTDFQTKKDNIKIDVSNRHDYLSDELETIKKSLVDKKNELKVLKENQQTNENDEQINVLKQEIFDIKQRQLLLEGKIENYKPNFVPSTIQTAVVDDLDNLDDLDNVEPITRSDLQTDLQTDVPTDLPTDLEPITRPITRPIRRTTLQNEVITGGALPMVNPSNMYNEYNMPQSLQNSSYQNPLYQNQLYQNPLYQNQLYQNSSNQFHYPPLMFNPFLMSNPHLYNVTKNKESKLSFYISIELELFPGKSVNAFQKSMVKCNSTFEKIREAYSEIFGYQHRPKPYLYNNTNKTETSNSEPGKSEPSKPEPGKTEPSKTEPSKTEPTKTEPSKPEPSKPEPSKPQINKVGGFNKTVKIKRIE
jgi:hypothetical protein